MSSFYAHREDSPFHEAAFEQLMTLAEGASTWSIPWPCVHEFLATVTHPRIYSPPTPLPQAPDQVEAWLESPMLVLLVESDAHWSTLRSLLVGARIEGPQLHDARIAALCQQQGVRELWSADRDFNRFGGLRIVNPLFGSNGSR